MDSCESTVEEVRLLTGHSSDLDESEMRDCRLRFTGNRAGVSDDSDGGGPGGPHVISVASWYTSQKRMKPVINYEGSSAAKLEDAELARRIAGQPPAAAGAEEAELCRRYARRVFHYGLRHLRNDDRARDLVQDVLLTTLQKLRAGEVKDPERIGSFILGTARLTAHSTRRAGKRQDSTELTEDVAVCESSLDADPLARDLVARCLEKLQERHRTVVVLSFYAEQSTADIAGSLGMSSNNVRVIRHRGIAQLRSCLGIEGGGLAS